MFPFANTSYKSAKIAKMASPLKTLLARCAIPKPALGIAFRLQHLNQRAASTSPAPTPSSSPK